MHALVVPFSPNRIAIIAQLGSWFLSIIQRARSVGRYLLVFIAVVINLGFVTLVVLGRSLSVAQIGTSWRIGRGGGHGGSTGQQSRGMQRFLGEDVCDALFSRQLARTSLDRRQNEEGEESGE